MSSETENKIVRSEKEQERANEMFDALRDELLKRELSNTENYDKAILTLSSASLGLSLTAIRFVVPLESATYIWLIKLGWVLLLFSIITSLAAFLMSNKAISKQLNNARGYYKNGIADAFNRSNIFIKINSFLNYSTGLLFLSALCVILIFVTLNIGTETNTMSKDIENTKSTPITIIKSANIPTMEQAPGTQTTSQGGSDNGESNSGGNDSSSSSGTGGDSGKSE
ncbi:MAG: hypothetical protein JRE64_21355 [Deltaproteobacteria bacterium]|jgi:uncharacterized membrane protein YgcG|nr:hypothetical protein [Deltaproteobacteria bacterium]